MKKIILIAILFITVSSLQSISAQMAGDGYSRIFSKPAAGNNTGITFGVRGGLNFAKIAMNDNYDNDQKASIGFNLGTIADIPLLYGFYFQPGLFLISNGAKYKEKGSETYYGEEYKWEYTEKIVLTYLQLPLLASYHYNISNELQWEVNFGPYLAVALAGKLKTKWKETEDGETEKGSESESIFGNDYAAKRFDFGLCFGTGITWDKYYIGLRYDLGLTNMLDNNNSWKNRVFSINIGYNF